MKVFLRLARCASVAWLALSVWGGVAVQAAESLTESISEQRAENVDNLAAILSGAAPTSVDELRALQNHVRSLTERVMPATVGLQVGAAQGSGVIISGDGYILTAAHVIGRSGRSATVYLRDGRRASAQTLGTFRTMDAGLLKLDASDQEGRPWPHVPIGDSEKLQPGQWCLAMGHPGGLQAARVPVLRLGRILTINPDWALTTDCTLIGGDSGGPLLSLDGKVIGINSRIGGSLTANLHVPVNTFRQNWDRLTDGNNWGHTPGSRPYLGVQGLVDSQAAKIGRVFPDSPAEDAGLRVGDVIIRFAGHDTPDFDSLRRTVEEQEPGSKVSVVVTRGNERLTLHVVIGRVRE